MKTAVLITGLMLLLVANILMLYVSPYGVRGYEGFKSMRRDHFQDMSGAVMPDAVVATPEVPKAEGFASYFLESAGGAKEMYAPMGAFDGVKLSTGNSVSGWRYTAPDEKLMGAEFQPGPDSLFMFKNNQCKPECCGASFSCGGGCVCTTPQQRQYIAGRGGNRTAPEDSA